MHSRASGVLHGDVRVGSGPRYRLCFELASGGMGTVFLARSEGGVGVHRFVALKRVHEVLAEDDEFVRMFLDEVRIASRINHPNVCSVFDYEARHPDYFIVMEYLMGEPVSQIFEALERVGIATDPERVIATSARIIADACEGVHAAHELRDDDGSPLEVVHRDISPQNLFVTYEGAVKVLDFGLVRAVRSNHKTRTGIVKGKFGYLAPEAIGLLPVDRRVDVWGLGVVLWELLTGKRLFKRESEARALMAIAAGEVPLPSTINPAIPASLDAVVMRALSPVEDRYATARDFGRDLIRFAQIGARPVGMHDLSERMDQLFPGARARKLHLCEIAATVDVDLPPDRASEPPPAGSRTFGDRRSRRACVRPPPPPPKPRAAHVPAVTEGPPAPDADWNDRTRVYSTSRPTARGSIAPVVPPRDAGSGLGLVCAAGAAAVGILFAYSRDDRPPDAGEPTAGTPAGVETHPSAAASVRTGAPLPPAAPDAEIAATVPLDAECERFVAGRQYVFQVEDDAADPPRFTLVRCGDP